MSFKDWVRAGAPRSGLTIVCDTTGIEKMVKALDDIGKSPQQAVTRAASAGATVAKKAFRSAPVSVGETGNYKRAVQAAKASRHTLKRRKRGVAIYDIDWPESMNDVLQKPVKNPGAAGSKSTKYGHAYYPNSIEYGFLTRSKGGGYSYGPGTRELRNWMDAAEPDVADRIIQKAEEELEKLWQKAKHG